MVRKAILIAALLTIGAIINGAVACGIVVWTAVTLPVPTPIGPPHYQGPMLRSSDIELWSALSPERLEAARSSLLVKRGVRVVYMEAEKPVDFDEYSQGVSANTFAIVALEAGWPVRSLQGHRIVTHELRFAEWHKLGETTTGLLEVLPSDSRILFAVPTNTSVGAPSIRRGLPVVPKWGPFIFNSALFAVIVWLVGRMGIYALRTLTIGRRMCCHCSYVVGDADATTCPACGKPL